MIRAVFFDFDGTLYDRDLALCRMAEEQFATFRNELGVDESMFVGDHPEADIAGARNAGMLPVWKRKPYWEVPEDVQRIDQLGEILLSIL